MLYLRRVRRSRILPFFLMLGLTVSASGRGIKADGIGDPPTVQGGIAEQRPAISDSTGHGCVILAPSPNVYFSQKSPLELTVSLPKTSYVVHEPIRIRAVLRNVSTAPVRIMEVRYLGPEMESFYLQVESEKKGVERRQSTSRSITEVRNDNYLGEVLIPGAAVLVFFYPNFSTAGGNEQSWTFDTPGIYQVRLVYEVAEEYGALHRAAGSITSNQIGLTFRAPDKSENEILNALWESDTFPFAPETTIRKVSAPDVLASVIARYPNHYLTNYVRMRLANALSLNIKPEAAIDLLRELQSIAPEFRTEEVVILLARNLGALGRHAEAAELMSAMVERDSLLVTNYNFMWTYLRRQHPHASENPVTQWRVNRLNGVANPERLIRD